MQANSTHMWEFSEVLMVAFWLQGMSANFCHFWLELNERSMKVLKEMKVAEAGKRWMNFSRCVQNSCVEYSTYIYGICHWITIYGILTICDALKFSNILYIPWYTLSSTREKYRFLVDDSWYRNAPQPSLMRLWKISREIDGCTQVE